MVSQELDRKVKRNIISKINNTSTSRNGNSEIKFISLPHHQFTEDIENIFKDVGVEVTYEIKRNPYKLIGYLNSEKN